MTLQMPFSGFLLMQKLVRICTSSPRHVKRKDLLVQLVKNRNGVRTFSSGSVKWNEREDSDSSHLSTYTTPTQAPLAARRRRPLSPMERISGLLPLDALSPEVMQLREPNQQEADQDSRIQTSAPNCENGHPETPAIDQTINKDDESNNHPAPVSAAEPNISERWISATLPGEKLLRLGELIVAEYYKKGQVEFRKMFTLQAGARLQSSWGILQHDNIAGQPAGRRLKTNMGIPVHIRRASLDDFVVLMKRGPAIAYPKDAATMLMMMDITEGDCVLESGSGSGAMSLFLSRAVGSKGSVLSVEVREDHIRRSMLNYNRWRTAWSVRRGEEWPDNVQFHNADLRRASSLLDGRGFHAIALDMLNPHLVLPTVIPHLHHGAVCAVYLANISQVIDLLDGLRCLALPLLCELIVEVPVRHWLVRAALQKSGQYCTRKSPTQGGDHSDGEEEGLTTDEHPTFGSVPYIARPHPEQPGHTAFLVKLRKVVR